MIKILVDSSSELTKKEAEGKRLFVCAHRREPRRKRNIADGVDLTKDKFYRAAGWTAANFPQTSQPSPQALLELFEQANEGCGMRSWRLLLSSALSGTYQSAVLAKQMVDYEGIYLIDSLTATGVIQILADYAQGLSEEGKGAAEVAERTDAFKSQGTRHHRHGRHPGVPAKGWTNRQDSGHDRRAGPAEAPDYPDGGGRVGVIGKAIGKNKAMSFMMKWLEEHPVDEAFPSYSIFTSGTANCEQFEEKLEKHGIATAGRLQLGAAIGTHIGPNAFGIVYVGKEYEAKSAAGQNLRSAFV